MEAPVEPSAGTSVVSSAEAPASLPAEAAAEPSAAPVAETPVAPSAETLVEGSASLSAASASAPALSAEPLPGASSADDSAAPLAGTSAASPADTSVVPSADASDVPSADASVAPPADASAPFPPAPPSHDLSASPSHAPSESPAPDPTAPPSQTPTVIPPRPDAPPSPVYGGDQPPSSPPVGKDRRVLRAVLRWTAAVVVFAVAGGGTAYGVAQMKRSDVPGLATASDGRWEYPEITRPPLPSGSPGPFAGANKVNAHFADLRALLLPAPKGAKADASLRGTDGWLPAKSFLAQYADADDRKELGQKLTDDGLRHIAARGWTTPDGTHTRIYLLQFDSAVVVDELFSTDLTSFDTPVYALDGAPDTVYDGAVNQGTLADNVSASAYTEEKPSGAEDVRQAYLKAGDTLALVVQSRKGAAKKVPFLQTVALQSQLLG